MTGCGERKMSEEEIQKKSEALCMKVFELKGEFLKVCIGDCSNADLGQNIRSLFLI